MTESIASLRHLKRQIAAIEQREGLCDSAVDTVRVGTGHDGIDQAIGGGLARGRLHEVFAHDAADAGCAAGFVGMLAVRLGVRSSGCARMQPKSRASFTWVAWSNSGSTHRT